MIQKPTLNRMSGHSILEDDDYKKAVYFLIAGGGSENVLQDRDLAEKRDTDGLFYSCDTVP